MAHDDIIHIKETFESDHPKKKKKVDQIALSSPFMRIPKMDVHVARDLIDAGIIEIYQLQGRSAESIFEEILKNNPDTPKYRLSFIKMAIYFSENENPDAKLLHPAEWAN